MRTTDLTDEELQRRSKILAKALRKNARRIVAPSGAAAELVLVEDPAAGPVWEAIAARLRPPEEQPQDDNEPRDR